MKNADIMKSALEVSFVNKEEVNTERKYRLKPPNIYRPNSDKKFVKTSENDFCFCLAIKLCDTKI